MSSQFLKAEGVDVSVHFFHIASEVASCKSCIK